MAWLINHDHETETHVIPFQDLKEHTLEKCECSPIIKTLGKEITIVIHNAYDKREELEMKLDSLVPTKPGLNL